MNKGELVAAVKEESGLTAKESKEAVEAMLNVISKTLTKGEDVQLIGFGSFAVKNVPARTGRNPRTGEAVTIAAKKVPIFKAGKALKEAVNG